ncbi:TonB-dependent receptor [Sphingobium jiangsuense]|nr:TonB-dependent receptor [Sphingobium jiangsuense]
MRKSSFMMSAALGGLLLAEPAWSQDAPDSASIQDIIVTAQRRAENIQNVPIAITAISGDVLASTGIDATSGLIAITPGLNYTVAAGIFAQPKIRGIGTSSNGPGIENPVATYIDGVYISAMSASLLNLTDVEQVAVLKGPQGTLFGRNATGGLIQITTRQPEERPAMDFSIGYANLDTVTGSAYLNGGLTDGLAANVSVYYQNRGKGFGTNLANGRDVYAGRNIAARGKIRWQPGPTTTVTLSGDYAETTGSLPGMRVIDGGLNAIGLPFTGGPFDVSASLQPHARLEQYGGSLTIVQDIGSLEFQSITAARKSTNNTDLDYDATFLPIVNTYIGQYDRQFSQEFQIQPQSAGGLQWIVGGYYFWAKSGYDPTVTNGLAIPSGASSVQNSSTSVQSLAAYGQATLPLGEDTNVTAGIRYTTDLRKVNGRRDIVLPNGFIVATDISTGRKRFSEASWRLALDHRFSPELLAYASYNRGFKSGAYLIQAYPAEVLKPEILDAFEAGIKSDLFDRRVRLNLAGFYYDYKNIQVQLINNGLITAYQGSGAKLYGVDADLTVNVTGGLTLNAGASWLHHRYKSFTNAFTATPRVPVFPPPAAGPNGGNVIGTDDATGNRLQAAPDWTLNIGGNYRIDMGNGHLDLNANYYHNDGWYAEVENRVRQPAYDLVNASIAYSTANDGLTLSLWGKNLFDKVYAAFLAETDVGDLTTPAEGRTYGVTLSVRF